MADALVAACWFNWRVVSASAALAVEVALRDMRCEGVCAAVFTLPALLPAVELFISPLVVMPPTLVLAPALLEAVVLVFGVPVPAAALALDAALLFMPPAGVLTEPVVFIPVPAEVPAAPVVAPTPAVPVAPIPAATAGTVSRTAPHSSAEMQALLRVLFIVSLLGRTAGTIL